MKGKDMLDFLYPKIFVTKTRTYLIDKYQQVWTWLNEPLERSNTPLCLKLSTFPRIRTMSVSDDICFGITADNEIIIWAFYKWQLNWTYTYHKPQLNLRKNTAFIMSKNIIYSGEDRICYIAPQAKSILFIYIFLLINAYFPFPLDAK